MTRHASISAPHTAPSAALRGVRWFISPDALRLYAPAMLNGHAAQVREAELIIDLAGESPRALLRLCYGPSDRADHALPLPAADVKVTPDESGTMEHIEIPGVISLTIGRGRGSPKLIYAHSPLLAAIGLPGGVYDVPELLLA
jgi:hypothetical protein